MAALGCAGVGFGGGIGFHHRLHFVFSDRIYKIYRISDCWFFVGFKILSILLILSRRGFQVPLQTVNVV